MFKRGERYIIGGKKAQKHYYTSLVGMECMYIGKNGDSSSHMDSHTVSVPGVSGISDTWYVQGVDILPITYNSNVDALHLLKKDV